MNLLICSFKAAMKKLPPHPFSTLLILLGLREPEDYPRRITAQGEVHPEQDASLSQGTTAYMMINTHQTR